MLNAQGPCGEYTAKGPYGPCEAQEKLFSCGNDLVSVLNQRAEEISCNGWIAYSAASAQCVGLGVELNTHGKGVGLLFHGLDHIVRPVGNHGQPLAYAAGIGNLVMPGGHVH